MRNALFDIYFVCYCVNCFYLFFCFYSILFICIVSDCPKSPSWPLESVSILENSVWSAGFRGRSYTACYFWHCVLADLSSGYLLLIFSSWSIFSLCACKIWSYLYYVHLSSYVIIFIVKNHNHSLQALGDKYLSVKFYQSILYGTVCRFLCTVRKYRCERNSPQQRRQDIHVVIDCIILKVYYFCHFLSESRQDIFGLYIIFLKLVIISLHVLYCCMLNIQNSVCCSDLKVL